MRALSSVLVASGFSQHDVGSMPERGERLHCVQRVRSTDVHDVDTGISQQLRQGVVSSRAPDLRDHLLRPGPRPAADRDNVSAEIPNSRRMHARDEPGADDPGAQRRRHELVALSH
jgi:hypothetical protein